MNLALALLLAASPSLDSVRSSIPRSAHAVSDSALSIFREPAPDRCSWLRVDPVQGRRELVAEFPLSCEGLSAAWSPDGSSAIVEFPGEWEPGAGRTRHAWRVDLTTRPAKLTALELPRAGMLDVLAFDSDGSPLALFVDASDDMQARELAFEGKTYAIAEHEPGAPALAHAFRLRGSTWQRIETVATTSEACDALGARRLDAADRVGRTTARLLDPTLGHDLSHEPIGAELFDELESFERIDAESTYAWVRLETERAAVLAVEGGYSYAFLTTPVLLVDDDGVRELDGMAENAVLAAELRGRYLLLSEAVSGARPLLYDLEGGRLLYSSDDAVVVTFWPAE